MALTSTMYACEIELADVDRGCYGPLEFRMAMHPSESPGYFVARLLAYCLEHDEGIGFSKGVSDPDEPPLFVRDLTGTLTTWIEIGAPDAARLHKASKAANRVAVYTHKDPLGWLRQLEGARVYKPERIQAFAFDREFVEEVVEALDRRMRGSLSVTEGTLYLELNGRTMTGSVEPLVLPIVGS